MSRYAVICFEHDHRAPRENAKSTAVLDPPCFDLDVDVRVPWSWVEATIGEMPVSSPAKNRAESAVLALEETMTKIEALADRYQPACPACKEPLHYTAWSVEDYEDD